jgi:cytidylate kinase
MQVIPVIAIDGPSASGKGTVAQRVAQRLGFHYLDSGAIYRAAGVAAMRAGISLEDAAALATCAASMDLEFRDGNVLLGGADITLVVRSEEGGRIASRIAALPLLRAALLERQRKFRQAPGLVADGRDMATVVFPDAGLKVFLTADVAERARRRTLQLVAAEVAPDAPKGLIEKENSAIIRAPFDAVLAEVMADLNERDRRDSARSAAPLKRAPDAMELDTTAMSIDVAVETVCGWFQGMHVRQ